MEELEKLSVSNNPEMTDVVITAQIFFLHHFSNSPETIEFSRFILRKLCSSFSAKRIDNVFGKVVTPSVKDNECDIWVQGLDWHTAYEIYEPVQKQPADFLGALCNNAFQQALIKFLVA